VAHDASDVAELHANAIYDSLICTSHTTRFPSNNHAAAQHAMNAASSHPAVQNARDTVVNGEVSASTDFSQT
jgi:hypothetical protein